MVLENPVDVEKSKEQSSGLECKSTDDVSGISWSRGIHRILVERLSNRVFSLPYWRMRHAIHHERPLQPQGYVREW